MSFDIKNLDDRQFEDLVTEATRRLQQNVPELTHLSPGDPAHAFIDLFAWLTETILYRANLIPERQRQAFLNLLNIPLRPAVAATSLLCIDSAPRSRELPALVEDSSELKAGKITFSTQGEVQPTPLQMQLLIKQKVEISAEDRQLIQSQYISARDIAPFQSSTLLPGRDTLSLQQSIDKFYYLAFTISAPQLKSREHIIRSLAGKTINIAIAPDNQNPAEVLDETQLKRELTWELIFTKKDTEKDSQDYYFLPLKIQHDSSNGGKQAGIVRLTLPDNPDLLGSHTLSDNPLMRGYDQSPPGLQENIKPEQVLFWFRLSSRDDPHLPLSYLAVNGVKVIAQGVVRDKMIARASGAPNQQYELEAQNIDPQSLTIQVENGSQWETWQAIDYFQNYSADEKIYQLDRVSGRITFGNGINGKRPAAGQRIRAAFFRYGGGSNTNLPANSIRELVNAGSRLIIRHEIPATGGQDAESVSQAEQRIGAFLNHRNRAVTADDFIQLTLENPVNPVARAEVINHMLPGNSINDVRTDVPGAVSVLVIPPGNLSHRQFPKPTRDLLNDVFAWLQPRCVLGTELYVLSPEFIPMAVTVHIRVTEPSEEQSILRRVEDAVYAYLWPLSPGGNEHQGWPFQQNVNSTDLLIPVARQTGVASIYAIGLFVQQDGNWIKLQDGQSLPINQYQLPECLAVSIKNTDATDTHLPDSLNKPQHTDSAVAAPVIPERCE